MPAESRLQAGLPAPRLGQMHKYLLAKWSRPLACLGAQLLLAAAPLHATTFYLTVAGLGGEPDYETRFHMLADETDKLLKSGGAERVVVTLEGPGATKQAVLGALSK